MAKRDDAEGEARAPDTPPEAERLSGPLLALYARLGAWRKQAEPLYTVCQTQPLEWPSLAVEWLPDRRDTRFTDFTLHQVLVGTQALPGSLNYVASVEMAVPVDMEELADFIQGEEAATIANGALFEDIKGHTRLTQLIPVNGAVHKLRAMPSWSHIVAMQTSGSSNILVHHLPSRPAFTADPEDSTANLMLKGLRSPGFALEWCSGKAGLIAAGSDDGGLAYWDVEGPLEGLDDDEMRAQQATGAVRYTEAAPQVAKFNGHNDAVHDVSFHPTHTNVLASASQDGSVAVWDTRVQTNATVTFRDAHEGGAFGVSLHPTAVYSVATCGADGAVSLWDMRRADVPTHELMFHTAGAAGVQWSPFSDSVLLSYGLDGNVCLWNLERTGLTARGNAAENAPSELAFLHAGHLSRVTEARWCPSMEDEWLVASTDATNFLQVFRPCAAAVEDHIEAEEFDVDIEE